MDSTRKTHETWAKETHLAFSRNQLMIHLPSFFRDHQKITRFWGGSNKNNANTESQTVEISKWTPTSRNRWLAVLVDQYRPGVGKMSTCLFNIPPESRESRVANAQFKLPKLIEKSRSSGFGWLAAGGSRVKGGGVRVGVFKWDPCFFWGGRSNKGK